MWMFSADAMAISVPNDGATRPSSTMLTIAAVNPVRPATVSSVRPRSWRTWRILAPMTRSISSVSISMGSASVRWRARAPDLRGTGPCYAAKASTSGKGKAPRTCS